MKDFTMKVMKDFTMRVRVSKSGLAAIVAAVVALPVSVSAADIRVMCYQDGNECDVTAALARRFEAQNTGIKVILDVVPCKTSLEQLPVQLAGGQGREIARLPDLGRLSEYYRCSR